MQIRYGKTSQRRCDIGTDFLEQQRIQLDTRVWAIHDHNNNIEQIHINN